MHRDNRRYGSGPRRGLCSKQFLSELHDQGVARDDAIQAVSQMFGVPRGAAQLFVQSHPAWAGEEVGFADGAGGHHPRMWIWE